MRYQLRHYPRLATPPLCLKPECSASTGRQVDVGVSRPQGRHTRNSIVDNTRAVHFHPYPWRKVTTVPGTVFNGRVSTTPTSKTPRRVSARLQALAPSATLAVDARQRELRAAGHPIISFGAGEPDFPTPDHIVAAAAAATGDIRNHKYSDPNGLPELREAICAKVAFDAGVRISPSCVVVTNGAKQANFEAWAALIDPGDNVLLPSPYWVTYPEVIKLFGGTVTEVYAPPTQGFKVNVEQLEAARTDKTKALLLCSPTNPTGAVYSAAEVRAIGAWALEHGIWLVVDEIYEHLTYDGVRTAYPLAEVPELAAQTLVIGGVSKSFAMTGWRVGWLYGPADVMAAVKRVHSHLTGNVNNVAQRATIAALTGPRDRIEDMREGFARRRTRIVSELAGIDGVKVAPPDGAFYVFADVAGLLGGTGPRRATSSLELADQLLGDINVAAVPGEAFGVGGFLRFSYALSDAELAEGMARLHDYFA